MTGILDQTLSMRLKAAYSEVSEVGRLFVMGLRQHPRGQWIATIAMDDLLGERNVHEMDPSLFHGESDDAPSALRIALANAKRAHGS